MNNSVDPDVQLGNILTVLQSLYHANDGNTNQRDEVGGAARFAKRQTMLVDSVESITGLNKVACYGSLEEKRCIMAAFSAVYAINLRLHTEFVSLWNRRFPTTNYDGKMVCL